MTATATVFPDVTGREAGPVPLPELLAAIEAGKPRRNSKDECPLFSPFTFGDKRSPKGSLRWQKNALSACAVVADYDAGTITPELARDKLAAFGIRATLYTTARHTAEAPRWRIVAPTARELAKAEYRPMLARLNGLFAGAFASESFAVAQAFYFGRVDGRDFVAYHTEGKHVDELEELDGGAIYPDAAPYDGDGAPINATTDTELRETIRTGADGVQRAILALSARWVARGMTADDIAATLAGLLDGAEWKDREPKRWHTRRDSIARCVATAFEKFGDKRERDPPGADEAEVVTGADAGAELDADRYPEPRDLWKVHAPGPLLDVATALPACLAEIVEPVAEARGHDVGALALSIVCALSACLCQRARIAAHPTFTTWQEGSAVWGALIGESGNGKTPSMQFAVAPLSKIESANMAEYMRAKEMAGEGETPPEAERLLMANATIEALGVQYANTAHRLLNYRDEGTAFINGMGRYNGKSDAERGDWCSAWNCAPHSVDRISRESLRHDDWGVSLLIGLTPSQMKEATDEARQDGLLARMLQCVVRPVTGKEQPSSAEALAAGDYGALARAVYGLGVITAAPNPAAADLFATARAQFAQAADVFAGNNRQMAVWLRKAAANSLRVALVFAAATAARARVGRATGADVAPVVDDRMAERAVRFVNWSACHALAFSELNTDSPVADLAQRVALFLLARKYETVTRRELARYVSAWVAEPDERIRGAAILHLFDAGWLTAPAGRRATRGPGIADATAWHVNPVAIERFTDYGAAEVTRRREVRARMLALGGADA